MRYVQTVSTDGTEITITKDYDPGETYKLSYSWKGPGRATKAIVESLIPNSKFLKVVYSRLRVPDTLELKTFRYVVVEFIKGN